jgi:2-dehydro-3-deoxygalactonokinase
MNPALIGVDWGTSAFRTLLIGGDGKILDRRSGPNGILTVKDGDFAGVLSGMIGAWLGESRVPVLMSGMIGSRQGWIETPYVTTPAGVADLAAALVPVKFDGAELCIVTGIETASATMRDVVRGEETQVFGALQELGAEGGRFLLPGTHSKWVLAEGARIVSFSTYMTGEIYAALRNHTILGRLMQDGGEAPAAFARGVNDGSRAGSPGALLNRLFGVRTAGLFGELSGADLPDYLSGLLIGAEIADASATVGGTVHVIASDQLAQRYRHAARALGIDVAVVPEDCVAAGHLAIARAAKLI